MADILMAVGLVLLGFGFAGQTALLWMVLKDRGHDGPARHERELDEKVQTAMEEETRRSRAMDEGFDNLMRFSVNGSDGFDSMKPTP